MTLDRWCCRGTIYASDIRVKGNLGGPTSASAAVWLPEFVALA